MAVLSQGPGVWDTGCRRGDDITLNMVSDVVLDGWTWTCFLMKPDRTVVNTFTLSYPDSYSVRASLTDAQTAVLTCNSYMWELVGTFAGYTQKIVEGQFVVRS